MILAFVRPGCGPCEIFLSQINGFIARIGESSLQVLIIGAGDVDENARLAAEHELLSPMVVQQEKEVADRYKTQFTPYAYVIDAHGVVRGHGIANTSEQVEQMLASAGQTEFGHGDTDHAHTAIHSEAKDNEGALRLSNAALRR